MRGKSLIASLAVWLMTVALALQGLAQAGPSAPPAPAPQAAAAAGPSPQTPRPRPAASAHDGITAEMDCSACHTEAGWDSIGNVEGGGFDHDRTGFPLRARHSQTPCTGCHVSGRRVSRECVACHSDPHGRRLGADCSACHSAVAFQQVDILRQHRNTRLPLTGIHALLDCTSCHQRRTDMTFTDAPANCYACHADQYRRQDIHPRHTGTPGDPTRPPFPTDCAQCHRASGWAPAVVDPEALRVELATAGLRAPDSHELRFPLRSGAHRGLPCVSCHADETRPELVGCIGCHTHGPTQLRAQHRTPLPAGTDGRACLSCHPGGAAR